MASILQVHPADDAIVALSDLAAGAALSLNGRAWTLREKIPGVLYESGRSQVSLRMPGDPSERFKAGI